MNYYVCLQASTKSRDISRLRLLAGDRALRRGISDCTIRDNFTALSFVCHTERSLVEYVGTWYSSLYQGHSERVAAVT
jgi:hypothetical protein